MIYAEPGAYTMQLYSATSGRNSVYVKTPIDSSNQLGASFLLGQLEALKKASCSIPLIWPLLVLLDIVGTDPAFQTGALKWKHPVAAAMYLSVYWHEPSAHKYHLALYLWIEFQQLQLQAYSFMLILWIDSWLLISYDKSIEKWRQAQNSL